MRVVVLARKPVEGSISQATIDCGCGGLNIDGCRIPGVTLHNNANGVFRHSGQGHRQERYVMQNYTQTYTSTKGRWPTNVILHGKSVVADLDVQSGYLKTGRVASHSEKGMWGSGADVDYADVEDGGGASRFFKQVP